MEPSNRWITVNRFVEQIEGRVKGLGGSPGAIEASPWGTYGPPKDIGCSHGSHCELTGKVDGVVDDRFGDFEGFFILTEEGHEHTYRTREVEIEALARYAWLERVVIKVVTESHCPNVPVRIILLQAPVVEPAMPSLARSLPISR
jgi:hypothetical protein